MPLVRSFGRPTHKLAWIASDWGVLGVALGVLAIGSLDPSFGAYQEGADDCVEENGRWNTRTKTVFVARI